MATRFLLFLAAFLLASLPACSPEEVPTNSVISSAQAREGAPQPLSPAPAPDAVADGNVHEYH